jgi:hypothetical protein
MATHTKKKISIGKSFKDTYAKSVVQDLKTQLAKHTGDFFLQGVLGSISLKW